VIPPKVSPRDPARREGDGSVPPFETERLIWVPWTLRAMDAILADQPGEAERILGLRFGREFPTPGYRARLPYFRARLAESSGPIRDGVIGLRSAGIAIGTMGFKSPHETLFSERNGPPEGVWEIGYGLVPAFFGRGYATEMGRALVAAVLASGFATRVVATCEADNGASVRVLEKMGFREVGRDGALLAWEHAPNVNTEEGLGHTDPSNR
jgi:ribosomal-protein-alanine N-acetyltransferase